MPAWNSSTRSRPTPAPSRTDVRRAYSTPQVQSRPAEKCLVEGCERLEELASGRSAGGLCAGHRYRKKKNLPLEPPLHEGLARRQTPRQALTAAVMGLLEVGAEGAADHLFRLALERVVYAALRVRPGFEWKSKPSRTSRRKAPKRKAPSIR